MERPKFHKCSDAVLLPRTRLLSSGSTSSPLSESALPARMKAHVTAFMKGNWCAGQSTWYGPAAFPGPPLPLNTAFSCLGYITCERLTTRALPHRVLRASDAATEGNLCTAVLLARNGASLGRPYALDQVPAI